MTIHVHHKYNHCMFSKISISFTYYTSKTSISHRNHESLNLLLKIFIQEYNLFVSLVQMFDCIRSYTQAAVSKLVGHFSGSLPTLLDM